MNSGERAANSAVLRVLSPKRLGEKGCFWCDPQGRALSEGLHPADWAGEILTDARGLPDSAQYLSRTIDRVSRRSPYRAWVRIRTDFPPGGDISIPLRITADADDLPDDAPQASKSVLLNFAHPEPEESEPVEPDE